MPPAISRSINHRLKDSEPLQRCGWPKCKAACCVYGAWVDLKEVEDIKSHASLISPFMPPEHYDPNLWFGEEREKDAESPSGEVIGTRVIDDRDHYGGTACIFLRADYKCALQAAGEENNLHPWRFKPYYCILHPLDLDDHGRITLDEAHLLLAEPASCLRPVESDTPLVEIFTDELEYLAGEENK